MSGIEILAVIGIIGFVIFKQVRGEALHGKRAVLLPAILTVIGYSDLHGTNGAHLSHADLVCLAIGVAGSAVIGLAFGAITRLQERGGYLWAQLPVYGLWLWAAMFAWRGVAFLLANSMHAHIAASSSTLLFSLGVNRLAQAAVIVPRAMAMGVPFAPEKDGKVFMAGAFERGLNSRDCSDRSNRSDRYDRSGGGDWSNRSNGADHFRGNDANPWDRS